MRSFVLLLIVYSLSLFTLKGEWEAVVVDTVTTGGNFATNLTYKEDIMMTGYKEFLISFDKGSSWVRKPIPKFPGYSYIVSLDYINDSIFASFYQYGIYLSTDLGETWQARNNGISLDDPKDFGPGSIFAFEDLIFASSLRHIYYSTDRGENWQKIDTLISQSISPAPARTIKKQGNEIWIVGNGGIFYSSNNGLSWTNILPDGFRHISFYKLLIGKEGVFVGTKDYGILYSSDGGQSWQPKNRWLPFMFTTISSFAVYEGNIFSTNFASGLTFNSAYPGLFVSTDDGENWHRIIFDTTSMREGVEKIFIIGDTIVVVPTIYQGFMLYRAQVKWVISNINFTFGEENNSDFYSKKLLHRVNQGINYNKRGNK